jgi:hypothetical protein
MSTKVTVIILDRFVKEEYMRKSYSERLERGWPLLSVETGVNGDSESTHERGSSLVGLLVLSCRYKRFLPCLGCS